MRVPKLARKQRAWESKTSAWIVILSQAWPTAADRSRERKFCPCTGGQCRWRGFCEHMAQRHHAKRSTTGGSACSWEAGPYHFLATCRSSSPTGRLRLQKQFATVDSQHLQHRPLLSDASAGGGFLGRLLRFWLAGTSAILLLRLLSLWTGRLDAQSSGLVISALTYEAGLGSASSKQTVQKIAMSCDGAERQTKAHLLLQFRQDTHSVAWASPCLWICTLQALAWIASEVVLVASRHCIHSTTRKLVRPESTWHCAMAWCQRTCKRQGFGPQSCTAESLHRACPDPPSNPGARGGLQRSPCERRGGRDAASSPRPVPASSLELRSVAPAPQPSSCAQRMLRLSRSCSSSTEDYRSSDAERESLLRLVFVMQCACMRPCGAVHFDGTQLGTRDEALKVWVLVRLPSTDTFAEASIRSDAIFHMWVILSSVMGAMHRRQGCMEQSYESNRSTMQVLLCSPAE